MKTLWTAIICMGLISPCFAQTQQFPTVDLAMHAIGGSLSVRIGSETESPQRVE